MWKDHTPGSRQVFPRLRTTLRVKRKIPRRVIAVWGLGTGAAVRLPTVRSASFAGILLRRGELALWAKS
jgi:hypothetical protein